MVIPRRHELTDEEWALWEQLLGQLQARLAEEDRIAWTLWCIDGSVVRAHKHAAGARHRRRGEKPARRRRPARAG